MARDPRPVALQVAVVYTPFHERAFRAAPLAPDDWLLCAAVASSVLWVTELGPGLSPRAPKPGAGGRDPR